MKGLWLLLGALLAPSEPRDHYPMRLRNALDTQPTTTSQVEWTVSWMGGRDDGLVERHITRTAGTSVWQSNLGDENGYHPTTYGEPYPGAWGKEPPEIPNSEQSPLAYEKWLRDHETPEEEEAGTRNNLIYDGQAWHLEDAERPLSGTVQPLESARHFLPVNLASVGLAPCWWTSESNPFLLHQSQFEGFDSATFREGVENGLPTLAAEWGGVSRLTWRFDERFGGQPVRASFEVQGVPVYASETEYERIGARWFPKSARFYQGMSTSPYKMIDVQRATFDEPWHMQEITPTDIGALYGTKFGAPDGMKAWTGAELIPLHEYLDLLELYGVLPDPRIVEMLAELTGKTTEEYGQMMQRGIARRREEYRKKYGEEPWLVQKSPTEKDEWDVYVDKFLAAHKLPEPGVKRAHEIRDQSKKVRDAYRRKNAAELRKAKADNDSRKVAHYEGIEKRIFERVLVRSLKKLVRGEKDAPKKDPRSGSARFDAVLPPRVFCPHRRREGSRHGPRRRNGRLLKAHHLSLP